MSNDRPDYRGNPLDFIGTLADTAGGLGNWIANGTPDSGSIAGEIQQRYRDHCDAWSNGPTWVQQFDPGARLFLSNACKPWLDSQGSGDPEPDPDSGADIAGATGRCPTNYNVRVEYDINQFDNGEFDGLLERGPTVQPVFGPIVSIRPRRNWRPGFVASSAVVIELADGTLLGPAGIASSSAGRSYSLPFNVEVSIERVDGQPDTCPPPPPGGDPIRPNPNPRPDPGLDPEDEPFEREPGQPVLPMPEIPDPFGDPIQLPNFPLPRVDGPSLFPEDEPPLAEPGEPGTPETVGGDGEAEGEAEEDEILVGVLVEVDSAPGFARTVQNVSVPTYIGACYVYLGWEGQLDLQPEGQFLVDGQFFAAIPGMTHWRVRSAVGYTLTVTPFYAPKE